MPDFRSNDRVTNRLRRLVNLFNRGVITEHELTSQIADCATDPDFFRHIDLVPPNVIPRLREIAEHAPAHPEDCLRICSICVGPDFDYEAFDRSQRNATYWSALRLREFFYPGQPRPEFQPLKFAGVVEEAIERDGSVVIFGDIQSFLIRKNPIQLILPNGSKITTSATDMGFIKLEGVPETSDLMVTRFGRCAVYLDQNVKSPTDIPPKTEVWVDRSHVSILPEPQGI